MITIAICTYNNVERLSGVLKSLRELTCVPTRSFEILVIDNNSNDGTRATVEDHQRIWGAQLRYCFEAEQGLSHARNRALREALGDIVCFIDDDVVVDPSWLDAVADAFEKHSAAVVGGRSYLIFSIERPSWLPEHYEFLLSRLDYGDQVIVDIDKDLYGLNFCVKKDIALRVGGFDPSMGRCGLSLRSGEESDLLRRIRRVGGVVVYEPRAVVGHIVSPGRLKKRWIVRRAFAAGVDVQLLGLPEGAASKPPHVLIHLVRCCGSVVRSLVRGDVRTPVLFGKALGVIGALGGVYGSLQRLWLCRTQQGCGNE